MRYLFLLLSVTFGHLYGQVTPLPNAHAHNDYEHPRPLLDALAHGFTSVEADVHLIDGELYVAHGRPLFKNKNRTLKALYLQPLQEIVRRNGGSVYPNYEGAFYLMIDIKSNGNNAYAVLKQQLQTYAALFTSYENGVNRPGAVTILLSGNRPVATVAAESSRLVALDGRPSDLGTYDAHLIPVISDHYKNHLPAHSETDTAKLRDWVNAAHANGQKVRLWATPENESVWRQLLELGIDLLNTDQLQRLQRFLLSLSR